MGKIKRDIYLYSCTTTNGESYFPTFYFITLTEASKHLRSCNYYTYNKGQSTRCISNDLNNNCCYIYNTNGRGVGKITIIEHVDNW